MEYCGPVLPAGTWLTVRLGDTEARVTTFWMRLMVSVSAVIAVTEVGTSCSRCSRFCAVTTISETPQLWVLCAKAGAATDVSAVAPNKTRIVREVMAMFPPQGRCAGALAQFL